MTSILSPADFGIVAVASSLLMFINVIADLGVSKVLIQHYKKNENYDLTYNNGLTINLIIGLFFFLFIFLFSDELASFFGVPESYYAIKLISFQIVFQSLSSVHIAIRKKNLDFKFLFYLRLVTSIFPLLISIPFALKGYGYLSIIYAQLSTAILQSSILWIKSDWKPKFQFSLSESKYILKLSVWSTLEDLAILIPFLFDTYLISNFIDEDSLGIYSTSRTLFRTYFTLILGSLSPVIFSALSKIKKNDDKVKTLAIDLHKIYSMICIICGLIVYINRDLIEYLLFDSDWHGIGNVIGILFAIMSLSYLSSSMEDALRAKSYFKKLAINRLIITSISILILFYAVTINLQFYVFMRCILLLLLLPSTFYLVKNNLNIDYKIIFRNVKFPLIFYAYVISSSLFFEYIKESFIKTLIYNLNFITAFSFLFVVERSFFKRYILKIKNKLI